MAPSRLTIKMAGSSGPSPPLLFDPVTAFASELIGEDPPPVETAEAAETVSISASREPRAPVRLGQ